MGVRWIRFCFRGISGVFPKINDAVLRERVCAAVLQNLPHTVFSNALIYNDCYRNQWKESQSRLQLYNVVCQYTCMSYTFCREMGDTYLIIYRKW